MSMSVDFSFVREKLETVGQYILMISEVVVAMSRRMPAFCLVLDQFYSIGVLSLPVVAFTGFSTGLVLAAQSFFQLADKGLAGTTGLMVTKAMMVELGPVLTAFMVTGRVGAAMCAELGTMSVTEQVDALRSMAVNPLRYLIAPRFIAGAFMVPILTVFSCFMGILGGYLLSTLHFGMTHAAFVEPLPVYITPFDLSCGIVKAFFFGIAIITISCFMGLNTRGGAAGVGRATTTSVVVSYSVILVLNFLLTLLMNTIYFELYP